MKENVKDKKCKTKFLIKTSICFALLLITFLMVTKNYNVVLANDEETDNEFIYLSDIPYIEDQSSSAYKNICLNKTIDEKPISVKVENETYTFEKGIWAHATSTVVYDLSKYSEYDYFTAYLGLNSTATNSGNGVKFYIYTSNNGMNWDLRTEQEPVIVRPGANALFVKIDIKDAKFLKLYASDNGSNGNDYSVYADAKLIKEGYNDGNILKTIEEYDEIIKTQYLDSDLYNEDFELILLQRELVKNAGQYVLKRFASESEENKETLSWLTEDLENLRLYTIGGKPDGSYYNSLKVLTNLLKNYKSDFDITETTKYGTKLGDLYKRMAISLSLTHSTDVALWMKTEVPENQSNAVTRYKIYKDMHKNGNMKYTDEIDFAKWFEEYTIEEMRYVMNNIIDDQEILWLNEYTQSFINANLENPDLYLSPHPYMKYAWPNYSRPEYYDQTNKTKYDEKYKGIFSKYGVEYGKANVPKLWMNIEEGAIYDGISKLGSNNRGVHGVPSTVISQPGHTAFAYYTRDNNGNGFWTLNNTIAGWEQSGKAERLSIRMPLGWGNDSYVSEWGASYLLISQAAINDFENYEKSEKIIMIADIYKNDLTKQEEIYREALKVQSINLDAWYGLIKLYDLDRTKTEKDYYELAEEIAENLRCYPLAMYDLTNLIKPKLTNNEYSFKFTLLQNRILEYGKELQNNSKETYQPSATSEIANFLLGQLDKTLASFSFDGENANKIVLSQCYDNIGIHWEYSIDGKQTWNKVFFKAEDEHKLTLSKEQIDSITAEKDIYIHIVGLSYDEIYLFKIDILDQNMPNNVYPNDLENRVIGATEIMEWRLKETDEWTSYKTESPNLTGDKTIQVRIAKSGTKLASNYVTYNFTEDNQPNTRKYIPISCLSIEEVSSQATDGEQYGNVEYAIDGNYNTRWYSAWDGSDTKKYIVIKFDKQIALSAMDYAPLSERNGKILEGQILGSLDGEDYIEIGHVTWANNETIKTIEFKEAPIVQYIKIVGIKTSSAGKGEFIGARMFNFYQDLTRGPYPIADIEYSTTEITNKDVIVKLVNPSTEIKITNNNGSDTYIFKENGKFTFEFEDAYGNKGSQTAKVDWINKKIDNPEEPQEIKSEKYTVEDGYISKIVPLTKVSEFKKNIETEQEIVIKNKDGEELTDDSIITTGTILEIAESKYTLTVIGDIDGDGEMSINDLAYLKLHLIDYTTLEEMQLRAADMDKDKDVTINDLAQIKLVLIDLIKIN